MSDFIGTKLTMNLGERSYDIIVKRGSLENLYQFARLDRRVAVVTDSGVPAQYAQMVADQCKDATIITVPQGEASKSFKILETVLRQMLDFGMGRGDLVVAVGGGVVGDLAGFAASIYMRGIDFINCPTTTLSMIDSSIGGKTAVDLGDTKNIVGAFWQPKLVIVDPDTLSTLPRRHFINGLAEAVKAGLLADPELFSIFEKEDEKKTIEIVSSQSPNKRPDVETEEGKAKIQAHIDALAEVFINKVALHRDISPKNVIENFGGGDIFVGQNAVRIGLADSLASFEAIISDLNTQSTEKSFMNDTLEKTSVDIKAQERERMSQVLSAENVKGKEAIAQALLAKTDLSASDIWAILETVPVAKQTNALDVAMAQIKNPAITPSAEDNEETPEDVANRIASYTIGG